MKSSVQIREAKSGDYDSIWSIIEPVIAAGDTYVFAPDSDRCTMLDFWCAKDTNTYVANAGYMTKPGAFGKGIGRALAEFSLTEAKRLGYSAMHLSIRKKGIPMPTLCGASCKLRFFNSS